MSCVTPNNKKCLPAAILSALLPMTAAAADDPSPPAQPSLPTVVVTATRTAQSAFEIPASVDTVSRSRC